MTNLNVSKELTNHYLQIKALTQRVNNMDKLINKLISDVKGKAKTPKFKKDAKTLLKADIKQDKKIETCEHKTRKPVKKKR